MNNQTLILSWESRDPATSDDALRLAQFVSGLPSFDPVYSSWVQSRKATKSIIPIPLSESQAENILSSSLQYYDDGRPWPELGGRLRAGNAGAPPYDFSEINMAVTACYIGQYGVNIEPLPNTIEMQLSEIRASTGRPWRASQLRPLMKFVRDIWRPVEMSVMIGSYIFDVARVPDETRGDKVRILNPLIGWITYLPPDLAARAQFPCDVEIETLDDGAALVTLCEEPFDTDDAEAMARLHALETALRPIQS